MARKTRKANTDTIPIVPSPQAALSGSPHPPNGQNASPGAGTQAFTPDAARAAPPLTPEQQEAKDRMLRLVAKAGKDTKLFSALFFPKQFSIPFSSAIHDPIFKIIDDESQRKCAIAAPRGSGKTSICNLSFPAKQILYRKARFIIPVSASAGQAIQRSENLKRELLTNPLIKDFFKPIRPESVNEPFSKTEWIVHFEDDPPDDPGILVMPRGAGQQIRGYLHGQYRPDLIIPDDLETSEGVMSEDQREKLWDWFHTDLMDSVDLNRGKWRVIVIGTLLHEDSLLARLLDDPEWKSVLLSICDDDLHSNWPEARSDESLKASRASYEYHGDLDLWYQENCNVIIPPGSGFTQAMFKYYDSDSEIIKTPGIEQIILFDPARTRKEKSAETAIVGLGLDTRNEKIYVGDIIHGYLDEQQILDEVCNMAVRRKARVIGYDTTGLHEFIEWPLRNETLKRNIHAQLVPIHQRGKKQNRIASLIPYYKQGLVYHNRAVCAPLEQQLISFPRSKKWDIMDALANIIYLMEEGDCYLSLRTESEEDIEREFIEIERQSKLDEFDEALMEEDWRPF